ncbi:MAG: transcriptional regulator MraZ [Clostridia bacterium]|nr:division/cell wall cluster transcriptional repressor MraZ [Lachnospiraceae bacterium]NCC00078.1 transcriptional regulator MraZ [Clostridia bacterium]NCD01922.1 transcriptional regulator MraZ [Clostridia bacterium]
MFIGEYNHTLDAKGRLIVPSKLRESLGERFFLTKGLDGCLFVYPTEEWEGFTQKLKGLPVTNKDVRQFVRFFLAGASECEIDKQGRILIPANLRDFAKLEKDAVLVGVSNRIEIWNRDKWEEINDVDVDDMDDIAQHMEDIGISL